MRRPTRFITFALLLFLAAASTAVYAADITITESITKVGGGYDGDTATIGDLRGGAVDYTVQRSVIANRGLKLVGKDSPAAGAVFTCHLVNPSFYSGTFFVSKYLPTNGVVKVDGLRAVMELAVPVVDLSEARLTNNATVLVMHGNVEYKTGAAAAVVSMVFPGTPTISGSRVSVVGLTVVRATSVLSIGDSASMGHALVTSDGLVTVDACRVRDLRVAVVNFRSGMTLSDSSAFRVSRVIMESGAIPILQYGNQQGQKVTSGSVYILNNIESRANGNIFGLASGGQAAFFTADQGTTVSFLDITAKSLGVLEPVPRDSSARVFGQKCRIDGKNLYSVEDYRRAFMAMTDMLDDLRSVHSRECEPALCVPGHTTRAYLGTYNTCECECSGSGKFTDMCSARHDTTRRTKICEEESCYSCELKDCDKCLPGSNLVRTWCEANTCPAGSNCEYCTLSPFECSQCKVGFTEMTATTCAPCHPRNCRLCAYQNPDVCGACMPGYTVSGGQCVKDVGCAVDGCERCSAGNSESCDECLPTYGMTSAGTCKRCTEANCLTCGNGDGPCTSCASGYKISGSGCVSEDDAAAGVLRAGWVLLLAAVGSLILILV